MHQVIINLRKKRQTQKMRTNKEYCCCDLNKELKHCLNCLNKKNKLNCFKVLVNYLNVLNGLSDLNNIYYNKDIIDYLSSALDRYPDDYKRFVRKHLVKILFFISCLHFFRVIRWDKKKDSFIEIPYKFLKSVIGQRHYPYVLDILLGTGIVETDGYYIYNGPIGKGCEEKKKEGYKPGKAYGYRLSKRFRDCKFKLMPTHLKISKGLLKFKTDNQKYLIENLNRATIDRDMAWEEIEYSDKSQNAKDIQHKLIDRFCNKDFYQGISPKTNRVYNSVSGLCKEIRQMVRLDGEETAEIDISACQPLLLNTFYDKECEESRSFKKLTESGKFYDRLKFEAQLTHLETRQLKEELYRVLFGPMRWNIEKKIELWFKVWYPILWKKIQELKATHHSEVPILLQRKESDVVINGVVGKCRELNIPVLTIHDSFIIKLKDVKTLEEIIISEFKSKYNLTPKLKTVQKPVYEYY